MLEVISSGEAVRVVARRRHFARQSQAWGSEANSSLFIPIPGECQRHDGTSHRKRASTSDYWIPAQAGMTYGRAFTGSLLLLDIEMEAFCRN